MLDKIAKLDSQVVRAMLVAIVGMVTSLIAGFGLDTTELTTKSQAIIDGIGNALTAFGVAWGLWARINNPNPPLSDKAVVKTEQMVAQGKLQTTNAPHTQGGFARPLMLALLLAVAAPVVLVTQSACTTPAGQSISFEQRLKLTVDTHTAVTRTVTAALNSQLISSQDAEAYHKVAVAAREVIETAVTLKDSDISTAEGQLQLANDLLIELQQYLTKRGAQS